MDNKEKEMKRPLDVEQLTSEQNEKVVGGEEANTADVNDCNYNTAFFLNSTGPADN